jgi:threonine synthase
MNYYSTKDKNHHVNFREAVLKGIAPDGGLYMPSQIPQLEQSFFESLPNYTIQEVAFEVIKYFIDDLTDVELRNIVNKAINFDAPLVHLAEDVSILELFHGPTLAFKDFGARFLASLLAHYMQNENKELIILVATSGDTGSAVANGFYGVEGIKVFLLYPSGKVSWIQEQQLTTMNKNIYAFEVDGTFDDCQNLVKRAFLNEELLNRFYLSSANSINIARLIPQSIYYFRAYAQLPETSRKNVFSVPSGNFGNLTAGLIAKKMGLPIDVFIAAVNANDIFPSFISSGKYEPKTAIKTLSNAMDVGNPSNFFRIIDLYKQDISFIKENIYSYSISDEQTVNAIRTVHKKYKYILDPHGAVGYQAINEYKATMANRAHYVVFETAHPAKFMDIINGVINVEINIPRTLSHVLEKKKSATKISGEFEQFKSYILDRF